MYKRLPIAALSIVALLGACSRSNSSTAPDDTNANTSVAKDVDSNLENTEAHGEGASRPLTAPPPGNSH